MSCRRATSPMARAGLIRPPLAGSQVRAISFTRESIICSRAGTDTAPLSSQGITSIRAPDWTAWVMQARLPPPFMPPHQNPVARAPLPQGTEGHAPGRRAAAGKGDGGAVGAEQSGRPVASLLLQPGPFNAGFHGPDGRFAQQLRVDGVQRGLAGQGGAGVIEMDHPGAARGGGTQADDFVHKQIVHGRSSKIASISTATPLGRLATPTAVRAWRPLSPRALTSRLEAPLATAPWRWKSALLATKTPRRTIRTRC